MKALREAVEVGRRAQELTEVQPDAGGRPGRQRARRTAASGTSDGLFEGPVKVEIGPLGDFSQLVGFEDAVGRLGASEISVERFSEGRATLSMRLDEPVELLRELEEHSRSSSGSATPPPDNLILDVDEDQGPEQRAA